MSLKKCSKCNAAFECCNEKPGCWCEDLVISIDTLQQLRKEFDNCLCKNCLEDYTAVKD